MAMLEAYNKRLAEEMEARKMVARMLHDYITYQKDLLAQAEETLEVSLDNLQLFLLLSMDEIYSHVKFSHYEYHVIPLISMWVKTTLIPV